MSILDSYEILSVIGEGTFGVVRLGKVKATGEKVAIKILEKKKIVTKDDEERVEREIEILKKVKHINVIKIMKIEKDSEKIYIIMEFCEKGELFNHIVEEQKLCEIEAAYFYYQLINGLECIHYNGVVHRDLKPENLLISKDNILKIIDFGLSNYYNKKDLLSTPCGSPCYASPEMVSGKKYDGFMIDVWSTGIILFAMLAGYLPFEDPDNEILFQKILKCEVEFPDDLSEDAIDLMKKIMVTKPEERITLSGIKKHRFYLKGKKKFKSFHKNLVQEVEKNYDINDDNKNDEIKIENLEKENEKEQKEKKEKEEKEKDEENKLSFKIDEIKFESNSAKEIIKLNFEDILNNNENINNNKQKEEEKVNDQKKIEEQKIILANEPNINIDNNNNEIKENRDDLIENEKENKIQNTNSNEKNENNKVLENKNNIIEENNEININLDKNKVKKNNQIELKNNIPEKNIKENNDNSNNKLNMIPEKKNIEKDQKNNIDKKKRVREIKKIKNSEKKVNDKSKIVNQNRNNENNNDNIISYNKKNTADSISDINKKIPMQINNQTINLKKRKNKSIQNENNKDKNIHKKIIEKRANKNHKNNIITDTKETSTINRTEIRTFPKRKIINSKDINSIDNLEKNSNYNYNLNIKRKENKKSVTKKNKIDIENIYSNDENTKKSEEKKAPFTSQMSTIETKYNKINLNTSEKIRQNIKNSNNRYIPNLKNKVNIDNRKIIKEKKPVSTKQKLIQRKAEPLLNRKIEVKREKTPGSKLAQTQFINDKYAHSLNNNKLTKNEIFPKKDSFNLSNNNPSIKLNTIVNTFSEEQDKNYRKNIRVPVNYNKISNNKSLEKRQILPYNNENINNQNKYYSSSRDNHVSFQIYNLSNNNANSKTVSNSKEKINHKTNNSFKVNTNYSNNKIKLNNDEDDNIQNYSNRNKNINVNFNEDIQTKDNTNNFSERNKNFNVNFQNDINNKLYNSKTFNRNINIYQMYNSNINNFNNNINNYQLNTLPNKNGSLRSDIIYKRKFETEIQHSEPNDNKNKNYNILNYQNQYLNNFTLPEFSYNDDNNLQINENKNDIIKLSYKHKKNISDLLPPKSNEIYNQKLINDLEIKSPINSIKNMGMTSQVRYNGPLKNRDNYLNSNREQFGDGKLLNYISKNINHNLSKNEFYKLNNIKKTETFNHLNNNYISKTKNSTQNLNHRFLGAFSNSAEKYNFNNYAQSIALTSVNSPNNLYSRRLHLNNFKNNFINRRINSTYINNSSYDNNKRVGIDNYISDIKYKNIEKYLNNKLVKKGLITSTTKDKDNLNKNNIIIYDKNSEIDSNIYSTKAKPNYNYLSNYNLISNSYSTNGIDNGYGQMVKTQTSYGNLYNKKLDFDKMENNNYMIGNMKINNIIQRNNNKIYYQNNEKFFRNKKFIEQLNNRINIEERLKNNMIKNYNNDLNKYNYNRSTNPTNSKYNQIISKTSKQMIRNTNDKIEDLLMKLTKAKNDYKKSKFIENNNMNFDNQNIINIRSKIKPISFIYNQDLNTEISEPYIISNSIEDINTITNKKLSDALIVDSLGKNFNLSRKANNNRGIVNYDRNYNNYIFNNNNFYNNKENLKINLY